MSSQQSSQTYPPPADPFTQPVTILDPTGAPFNVTMDQFAWFHYQMTDMAVSRGAALGATAVMLLAVAFLTQRAKRGSPVFALNILALTLNVFRTLFMVVWVVGPYTNPYAVLTNDWVHITANDVGSSVAVPIFTFLTLGTILSSLVLQVRVALSTARRRARHAVLVVCGISALGALGTEMAVTVRNIKVMIIDEQNTADDLGWAMLLEANSITILLNMAFFTLIFVAKLSFAIWQQVHRLGSTQRFGPLQVLFIMGVQTLIVPTIMLGLQYATKAPEMSTWCLTVVCLSLPLSSLWAAATISDQTPGSSFGAKLPPSYDSADKSRLKSVTSEKSMGGTVRSNPVAPLSPMSLDGELVDVEQGLPLGKPWSRS